MFGVKISGEKNNKTCTPIVPSLAGKDTKAKDNLVSPDILMQIAWGLGSVYNVIRMVVSLPFIGVIMEVDEIWQRLTLLPRWLLSVSPIVLMVH